MSTLDPTVVQKIPTGDADAVDVGDAVVEYLTTKALTDFTTPDYTLHYLPDVAKDHESRIVFGEKKYGQRLKINNGRDALTDAYEECLDALSYLAQAHLEGGSGCLGLFYRVADIAAEVRDKLCRKTVTHQ
jgi:hypothetical protein